MKFVCVCVCVRRAFTIKPSLGVIPASSHQIFTVKFCPTSHARVDRHAFVVQMNDTDKYTKVIRLPPGVPLVCDDFHPEYH